MVADIHALHGAPARFERGYAAVDCQPIDLALWNGPFWGVRGEFGRPGCYWRGAAYDLVIAAVDSASSSSRGPFWTQDPARIAERGRPASGHTSAVEFAVDPAAGGRRVVAPVVNDCRTYLFTDPEMLRLLLESGMEPNLPSWLHTTPLHDLWLATAAAGRGRMVWKCGHFARRRIGDLRQGR